MERVELTSEQLHYILEAYKKAHNRTMSHGDQNTICQSIGQKEGIEYVLFVLGYELKLSENEIK
jgi:hypothetical protein